MKIAHDNIHVLNVLPLGSTGGAEKFVSALCKHHDRSRFDIKVCILFSGDSVANEIVAQEIDVVRLNMKSGFDLQRAIPLSAFIRRNRIDVVNIHGQNPLGKLFAVLGRPPLIIHTDHGLSIGSPVKRKKRVVFFSRLISPFINHYIAISKGMVKSLQLREKVPLEKISLIYNGVDVKAIECLKGARRHTLNELGIPDGIPILGTVGRICREKQYPILIQALSMLKSQGLEFVALIIGDGPLKSEITRLAVDYGLANQVKLLGNRNDVFQLLDIMDIFVFPSGGEAFSITILEAMAKSKPIVAFNVDGVNEAIENGITGFLVPFKNIEEFAQKIKILIANPPLSLKMGQAGHRRILAYFDINRTVQETEMLYLKMLQQRGKKL
jgi:glycosyltransferase involved in cell wall biosynthesis